MTVRFSRFFGIVGLAAVFLSAATLTIRAEDKWQTTS